MMLEKLQCCFEKDKIKFISYTIKKNKVQRDINVKTVDVNIKAVKKKKEINVKKLELYECYKKTWG